MPNTKLLCYAGFLWIPCAHATKMMSNLQQAVDPCNEVIDMTVKRSYSYFGDLPGLEEVFPKHMPTSDNFCEKIRYKIKNQNGQQWPDCVIAESTINGYGEIVMKVWLDYRAVVTTMVKSRLQTQSGTQSHLDLPDFFRNVIPPSHRPGEETEIELLDMAFYEDGDASSHLMYGDVRVLPHELQQVAGITPGEVWEFCMHFRFHVRGATKIQDSDLSGAVCRGVDGRVKPLMRFQVLNALFGKPDLSYYSRYGFLHQGQSTNGQHQQYQQVINRVQNPQFLNKLSSVIEIPRAKGHCQDQSTIKGCLQHLHFEIKRGEAQHPFKGLAACDAQYNMYLELEDAVEQVIDECVPNPKSVTLSLTNYLKFQKSPILKVKKKLLPKKASLSQRNPLSPLDPNMKKANTSSAAAFPKKPQKVGFKPKAKRKLCVAKGNEEENIHSSSEDVPCYDIGSLESFDYTIGGLKVTLKFVKNSATGLYSKYHVFDEYGKELSHLNYKPFIF